MRPRDTLKDLSYEELIDELALICGILPDYYDIFGTKHTASTETIKAILEAMGLDLDSVENMRRQCVDLGWRDWKSFVEPVTVISVNEQPMTIFVYIPIGAYDEKMLSLSWFLVDEKNGRDEYTLGAPAVSETQWIDGLRYIKTALTDREGREPGYYAITVECKHPEKIFPGGTDILRKTARVIITPETCYIPPELEEARAWGLSVNLYSIRSERNWGVGDFTDLKAIAAGTAGLGGGFVAINPLHSVTNRRPFGISPYSPVSRLFRNFIYLDMEAVPEVAESEDILKTIESESFAGELDKLRKGDTIDYEGVASLKEGLLRKAFPVFYERDYKRNTRRGRAFKKFLSDEGGAIGTYATYMALSKEHGENWRDWPREYRNPSRRAVKRFRKENREEVLYYQYVQWLIDEQLKGAAEEAEKSGMAVGLYHDLAIGAIEGGSDVWGYQDVVALGIDVGAPPDDFNPCGQNWGFPPLNPERLREKGYELFIQAIRRNMRYGGALRIDHALGLFRLFWIPLGKSSAEGAYVRYRTEELLRIIALESLRNRTIVIAEDLGTIGGDVRDTLGRFKMLSYRLFYFERNYPDPSFLPPERYPDMALCAVTTHDLPTLYGYWAGRDIEVKKRLGFYSDDAQWKSQIGERERDKGLILSAMRSQGIIPEDYPTEPKMIPEMTPELCAFIYRYLALTPCKLILVSLDDVIGMLDQQNLPGTVAQYPNWMRKTDLSIEEIFSDRRFIDHAGMLKKPAISA